MKVRLGSEEKIRTEKPLEELWLQLRPFESEFYSRQFLKEKYPDILDEELDKLSVIFASNIKQAYEYYSAASSVSILTSPLLYYYGTMCLTNVLWASLNKTETIKQTHGLKSQSENTNHLLSNEYVIVHKNGSFPALHSCFSDIPIKEGTKFYIKDVFSVIPEVKTLFEKIYNKRPRLIKVKYRRECTPIFDSRDYLKFQEDLRDNEDYFKQYNIRYLVVDPHVVWDETCYESIVIDYPLQRHLNGEIYFTLPIRTENASYAIPEALAHFMVMHCLGMLVRYEPVKWLQIVSGKLSSDINLINRFIEVSKRKFPNMILNGLLGKELQFTMSNIDPEDSYNSPPSEMSDDY